MLTRIDQIVRDQKLDKTRRENFLLIVDENQRLKSVSNCLMTMNVDDDNFPR